MIEIVRYSPVLQQRVVDFIVGIQAGEFGFDIAAKDQPDLLDVRNFYQSGTGNFWIALDADEVVGTIALRDIGHRQAALRKMFVKASHRGSGHAVALKLLEALVAHASAKHVHQLLLGTTEKFVAAHRFYEKNGFTQVAPETLPDAFPRMALDTRFYLRTLARSPGRGDG